MHLKKSEEVVGRKSGMPSHYSRYSCTGVNICIKCRPKEEEIWRNLQCACFHALYTLVMR